VRPEALPEAFWDEAKGEIDFAKLGPVLAAASAAEADRIADPGAFKWATTVKDDQGKPIEINAADPLVQGILKVGAEHGVSAKAMNAIADAFLTAQLASHAAEKAEFAKLGDKGTERFNAVLRKGEEVVGAAGIRQLLGLVGTVEQFEAIEKLVALTDGPRAAETAAGAHQQLSLAKRLYANAN
jgi:hypothetical protein